MECKRCGRWNSPEARFCGGCGAPLPAPEQTAPVKTWPAAAADADAAPELHAPPARAKVWLFGVLALVAVAVVTAAVILEQSAPDAVVTTVSTPAAVSPAVTAPPKPGPTRSPAGAPGVLPPIAPTVGSRAPAFTVTSLDGKRITLGDYSGRPLVLNFWATWCGPCRQEMPLLQETFAHNGEVAFLAVDLRENPAQVRSFLKTEGFTFDVGLDETGAAGDAYQVRYIPTTFFIDREGIIRSVHIGAFVDKAQLAAEIARIVPPAGAPARPSPLPKLASTPAVTPAQAPGATTAIAATYSGFYGFPDGFFRGSLMSREQLVKVTDAQYLSLKKMHNGIVPYDFCRIEYDSVVYASTMPDGVKLGDPAFPGRNSGHPRWEVMAHEQGHNFFGGTSAFYYSMAAPLPFLQESLAVTSAFYTYHDILENQAAHGIDDASMKSVDFDFANGRNYQKAMFDLYVNQGRQFDAGKVLTSQALSFKMITYGEKYGWQSFRRLSRAFENDIGSRFSFHRDGASATEQSTYIIAALGVAFGWDFRQEFIDLNFPVDDALYTEFYGAIRAYVDGE